LKIITPKPRVSDGSASDETAGLGPKGNSAVGNAETPEQRAIDFLEKVRAGKLPFTPALASALRSAQNDAYERAAEWLTAYANSRDKDGHSVPPTSYSRHCLDYAAASVRALKRKEP
jgi:hypothetical protein